VDGSSAIVLRAPLSEPLHHNLREIPRLQVALTLLLAHNAIDFIGKGFNRELSIHGIQTFLSLITMALLQTVGQKRRLGVAPRPN
jgi:hypothetical protein